MRPVLLAFMLGGLLPGCSGSSPETEPTPESGFGAYRFAQRMEDGSVLEGQFIITRDTVLVRDATKACEYESKEMGALQLVYQCSRFKLRFDRGNPAQRVYYEATVQMVRVQACRARRTGGAAPCDQSRDVVTPEVRSGLLRAVRIRGA